MSRLVVVFVLSLFLITPYVRGDGNGYYAYVRSVILDGDLNFENEYARADPKFRENLFKRRITPRGYLDNPWAPGSAVLWAPFFLAGHAIATAGNALGLAVPLDGFSPPYRWAVAVGTATFAFAGLLLGYRLARGWVAPPVALAAVVGIWVASSLPVYMYFLPMLAEPNASFVVALLLYVWHRTRGGRRPWQWAALGLLAGFSAAVKYETIVFAAVPALALVRARQQGDPAARPGWRGAALVALGFGVGLVPQVVIKTILYGRPWAFGYEEPFWVIFLSPRPVELLFSSLHGMFTWTPILLAATLGLFRLFRRDRELAIVVGVPWLLLFYLASCWQSLGVGGSSFGNRPFVSATPVFVLGLALALDWAAQRCRLRWIGVAVAALGVWNVLFIVQFGLGLIPRGDYFPWSRMVLNQFRVPVIALQYGPLFFTNRDAFIRAVQALEHEQRLQGVQY
ncbi:MAG: hypothetical protein A2X36_05745 [Elusimicrobia bacterium GWA2_69_24]|nr:MAG: hypothetical protein A2X52_14015 [Candidatus Rokubacteria bacterium GWC2_70_16]OGK91846.1 MAG: hypothetical protein A2W08_09440 [Candidatus Rokubacteria bacterium RBG_16_73_20]OGR57641.1 MAG: hypothetical protein A2X36_05745 [Elusimicrobia bacterium GWA2_69_24]HBH02526.1 hypothetical protein [Candidatus Rokubacteria bacterium]